MAEKTKTKTKTRTGDSGQKKKTESFTIKGEDLVRKFKQLVKEGNVRKITILNKNGKEIVVIPLTIGVVGAILLPPLAAVGAIAALVTECTIKVERYQEK